MALQEAESRNSLGLSLFDSTLYASTNLFETSEPQELEEKVLEATKTTKENMAQQNFQDLYTTPQSPMLKIRKGARFESGINIMNIC